MASASVCVCVCARTRAADGIQINKFGAQPLPHVSKWSLSFKMLQYTYTIDSYYLSQP